MHKNEEDNHYGKCKKTLNFGKGADKLTEDDVLLRLKRWMLKGLEQSLSSGLVVSARSAHQAVDARWECDHGASSEEVDARLQAGYQELMSRG